MLDPTTSCPCPGRKTRPGRVLPRRCPEAEISRQVLRFVMEHPGAVQRSASGSRYSGGFRRFVLDLRGRYPAVGARAFAHACQVPPSSLRAWARQPPAAMPARAGRQTPASPAHASPAHAAIIEAWIHWAGSFQGFCQHVRRDLGLPRGRSYIASVLAACGLRVPRPRRRRAPCARALRGAFQTFFPGAQWVADGSPMTLRINGEPFTFNVQLVVDTHSGAVVGASIRDREDGRAVVDAFDDAVTTTGAPPLALLLDQRPCNRSARVQALAGQTTLLHAARGRPQSKGHVEGAFGLFAQTAPPLALDAGSPAELARQVLGLVVQCWARTLNMRPRRDRGMQSRVDIYRQARPTEAERQSAHLALSARADRAAGRPQVWQQRALGDPAGPEAAAARGTPSHTGDTGDLHGAGGPIPDLLAELAIDDPAGRVAAALSAYPLDAVLSAMATYDGKRAAGTLPAGAGGSYVLSTARQIARSAEGMHMAGALWRIRARARAQIDELLERRMRALTTRVAAAGCAGYDEALAAAVDAAMAARSDVDRRLWLMVAARIIARARAGNRAALFRRATRRIHATPRLAHGRLIEAVRLLAAEAVVV